MRREIGTNCIGVECTVQHQGMGEFIGGRNGDR